MRHLTPFLPTQGKCCTGASGHVWLTKTDILDISRKLDLDSDTFLKKYTRWIPRIKRWSLIEKQHDDEYHCIFLDSSNKCSIYEVRPTQCRTYPYWPSVMESQKTWNEEKPLCEGIDNVTAPICPAERIVRALEEQIKDTSKTYELGRHPVFEEQVASNPDPSSRASRRRPPIPKL